MGNYTPKAKPSIDISIDLLEKLIARKVRVFPILPHDKMPASLKFDYPDWNFKGRSRRTGEEVFSWKEDPLTIDQAKRVLADKKYAWALCPGDLGLVVFDKDTKERANKDVLDCLKSKLGDPLATYGTSESHKFHAVWRAGGKVGNGNWFVDGIHCGETRAHNGYVAMWDFAVWERLADDSGGEALQKEQIGYFRVKEKGTLLDAETKPADADPQQDTSKTDKKKERKRFSESDVKDMLGHLTKEIYGTREWWVGKIGFAVHDWDSGERGFQLWHDWSKQFENYKDEADCRYYWGTFGDAGEDDEKVTIGTLAHTARGEGYRSGPIPTHFELAVMVAKKYPGIKYLAESGKSVVWLWHDGKRFIKGAEAAAKVRNAVTEIVIKNVPRDKQTSAFKSNVLTECKDRVEIVKTEDLDADGYLLAFQDKYLEAGRFGGGVEKAVTEPLPAHKVTKFLGCGYRPGAKCPKFDRFLNEIYCEDADLVDYELRRGGYDMLGSTDEQKLHFLAGGGANGKSTLIKILLAMMGDYGRQFRSELICGWGKDQFNTANLQGVRLATITELGGGLNPQKVKELTGGDTLEGERKFESAFNFDPVASILVSVNEMPNVSTVDYAIRRRIRIIPFNRRFAEGEQDRDLAKRIIRDELEGVALKYLDGLERYLKGDTLDNVPKAISDATETYFDEQDIVANWLRDRCIVEDWAEEKAQRLHRSFKNYAEDAGVKNPRSLKSLGAVLRNQHRIKGDRRALGTWWLGLKLKTEAELAEDAEPTDPAFDPPQ